ncbi:MAG: ribosome silencing factor [Phycisphaeraceae bacterium]
MPDSRDEQALPHPPNVEQRRSPAREGEDVDRARAFALDAARLAHDDHCQDILVLDVRGLSELMDFIVIATGTSDRQIKAVASHVTELAREQRIERFGADRDEAATWIAIDFIEVMVHLFEPNARAHYDLEMLWGDAERLNWQRPSPA